MLRQQVFHTLGVEYAHAQFFEFRWRSAGQPLLRPTRYRAEALFDLAAKDRQFAPLKLAPQNLILKNVDENWHLSRLLFYSPFKVPQSNNIIPKFSRRNYSPTISRLRE